MGVNSVAGFLIVRIYMDKPADATANDSFEISAVLVKKLKINMFTADTVKCEAALWLHTGRLGGWLAILVKAHLLSPAVA